MNRIIKFRAWMKKEFSLPNAGYDTFTIQELMSGRYDFAKYENWNEFTGLLDVHGVEIFEGDVLKPVNPPSPKKDNRVVEFIEGSFCYNEATTRGRRGFWTLNTSKAKLFEVIGNIYEHSHLLAPPK